MYEIIERLSGVVDVAPQGLHMIIQSLNLSCDINGLTDWAKAGFQYKKWVKLNGDWAILFVGNGAE